MGHGIGKIDRSTDVRTSRSSYGHIMLNFWHRSGAGDNRPSEDKDANIRAFGQFLKDMYYASKKDKHVGPQGLLNILNRGYKEFLTTHPEIEESHYDPLWKEIINTINEDITEVKYSIGLYALVIIQEAKKSIDTLFLENEIFNRNNKFKDELSVKHLGFKKEEIINIINDDFILQKIKEKKENKKKQ